MAHYLVTAKPKPDGLGNLLTNLRRNAYASMRRFGRTLTCSLQNARSRQDGLVTWEEEDYCSAPLAQERAAVLDEFFDEFDIARVQAGAGWKTIETFPRLFLNSGAGKWENSMRMRDAAKRRLLGAERTPWGWRQQGRALKQERTPCSIYATVGSIRLCPMLSANFFRRPSTPDMPGMTSLSSASSCASRCSSTPRK